MKINRCVCRRLLTLVCFALTFGGACTVHAQPAPCPAVIVGSSGSPISWDSLQPALAAAVNQEKSGLRNQMWATVVDRDGKVCAVAFSGATRGAQWPGSRIISEQKAYAANAFSLDASSAPGGTAPGQPDGLALSTANLYAAVQPGGSLFGLAESNLLNTAAAYAGVPQSFGSSTDPMVGQKVGGIITFGGGLPLYGVNHVLVGGLGVSGDTSCTDHNVAWRLRHLMGLDHMAATSFLNAVPGPASLFASDPGRPDNIIFDIKQGESASGFGHPTCLNASGSTTLPPVVP